MQIQSSASSANYKKVHNYKNEKPLPSKLNSRKSHRVQQACKAANKRHGGCLVYVGNIPGTVAQSSVQRILSPYGEIIACNMCCAHGCATTDRPRNRVKPLFPNLQYAVVHFSTSSSARRVLLLDGSWMFKSRIVATKTPYRLPEPYNHMMHNLQQQLPDLVLPQFHHLPQLAANVARNRPANRQRIALEDTVVINDEPGSSQPVQNRHRLFGFSFEFPKCIA